MSSVSHKLSIRERTIGVSFFIDEQDVSLLLDRLNADPEIAFIVPDGLAENKKAEPRRGLAFIIDDGELKAAVEPARR